MTRWYIVDVLPPVIAAVAVSLVAHWALPVTTRSTAGILQLATISAAALLSAALAAPMVRDLVWQQLTKWLPSWR